MKQELRTLLSQWGYDLKQIGRGMEIWNKSIPGYSSAVFFATVRDEFEAADYLKSIIRDDKYSDAVDKITGIV